MSISQEISAQFGIGPDDLFRFIRTAPARYKTFTILKRDGSPRLIAQPSSTLKNIQRYIISGPLKSLPVHRAAAAYVKGKGIVDNATAHGHGRYILKLDFSSFFPSIRPIDLIRVMDKYDHIHFSDVDKADLARLLFWGAGKISPIALSIGAPSSPFISNVVMYEFDTLIDKHCKSIGVSYTRYADDITLSAKGAAILLEAEKYLVTVVKNIRTPKLILNEKKRGLYGPGQRRMITGLVLTSNQEISLGRERKRLISAMIHRASTGDLDRKQMGILKGWIGFSVANEPDFVSRMREKYGNEVVDRILKCEPLTRNASID